MSGGGRAGALLPVTFLVRPTEGQGLPKEVTAAVMLFTGVSVVSGVSFPALPLPPLSFPSKERMLLSPWVTKGYHVWHFIH